MPDGNAKRRRVDYAPGSSSGTPTDRRMDLARDLRGRGGDDDDDEDAADIRGVDANRKLLLEFV